MNWKNKFDQILKLYFMLVTFITVLLMILGIAFDSDRTFSYQVFASSLIYAAIGVLPVFFARRGKRAQCKKADIKEDHPTCNHRNNNSVSCFLVG